MVEENPVFGPEETRFVSILQPKTKRGRTRWGHLALFVLAVAVTIVGAFKEVTASITNQPAKWHWLMSALLAAYLATEIVGHGRKLNRKRRRR